MKRLAVQLFIATSLLGLPAKAYAQSVPGSGFSFVVLGHIRGGENGELSYLLPALIDDVKRVKPDAVFLTGDLIWGQVNDTLVDRKVVERQWQQLDSALAGIGVPIYRVPGNHDINDPVTRDVFFERYGQLPRVIDMGGSRFVLLNSAFVPQGNGPAPKRRPHVRDLPLNAENIAALRTALADTGAYQQAFVLVHHLLWWEESAPWWRDVHPLMVGRKVRAVIGGDFGPMKFSHERRDGIDYVQTSMEGLPGARLLRKRMDSRLLSQQFDNYLSVRVNGRDVEMDVRPVGAIASGKFTPQRWREINQHTPSRREQMQAVWAAVRPPKRLALLVAALVVVFGAGFAAARMIPRSRR